MTTSFKSKIEQLFARQELLLTAKNEKVADGNGVFDRYKNPVLTAFHTPIHLEVRSG